RPAFQRGGDVTIYLAVPRLDLGKANAREPGEAAAAGAAPPDGEKAAHTRYQGAREEGEDENVNNNPQALPVRPLSFKLLLSTEDHSGYEALPIARVRRAAAADALPQLDPSYIPPLLACDAWKVLAADILQAIYHRVGKKVELRASQVVSR